MSALNVPKYRCQKRKSGNLAFVEIDEKRIYLGAFDSDTHWALTWFGQTVFFRCEYGTAEQLSMSKNTSVAGMAVMCLRSAPRD